MSVISGTMIRKFKTQQGHIRSLTWLLIYKQVLISETVQDRDSFY